MARSTFSAALATLALCIAPLTASAASFEVFDTPHGPALPASIDAAGNVAGTTWAAPPGGPATAFVRSAAGVVTVLEPLPNQVAAAYTAMNAAGMAIGTRSFFDPAPDGVSRIEGILRELDGTTRVFAVPGTAWARPTAINASGWISGSATMANGRLKPFLRAPDGGVTLLADPALLAGLNDSLDMAGSTFATRTKPQLGAVRRGGGAIETFTVPKDLSKSGVDTVNVVAINESGSVTGGALTTTLHCGKFCAIYDKRGFVRNADGTMTVFSIFWEPGPHGWNDCCGTFPYGINAAGSVVGDFFEQDGVTSHGFLRDAAGMVQVIDVPAMAQTLPKAINDGGVITGWCIDAAGATHGFIRWP
jgi:hypothetical protein